MSEEEGKDYICNNMTDEEEEHKYFIMIYELNVDKEEKQKIIKKLKGYGFRFDEKHYKEDAIRILGKKFVKQNKNKCKIIYNNKKYELKEYLDEIDDNYNHNIKEIKLKIIGINNIIDFSKMFRGCFHLLSVSESKIENIEECIFQSYDIFNDNNPYLSLFDEKKAKDTMEENKSIDYEFNNSFDLYYGCKLSSFENISSISKNEENYNSSNVENKINSIQVSSTNKNKIKYMECMFSCCCSLISLPDISKWDTSNIRNMGGLFEGCISLISLPDISKWNTSNVTDMKFMFNYCNKLISLPDISKWNTANITNMKFMFNYCNKLISLPDISKWNTSNVTDMNHMFNECNSLKSLPDIPKWNTSNVTDMNSMFQECNQLISLPDISKWDTSNVTAMNHMFFGCRSLISLPDISKWNTSKVSDKEFMFYEAINILNIYP